jgi:hypothetical protein
MIQVKEYIDNELSKLDRGLVAVPNEDYLLQFTEANNGSNDYLLMQMAKNYGYKLALLNVNDEIYKQGQALIKPRKK